MSERPGSEAVAFKLGDRVRIAGFDPEITGRVSELRGALGPGGVQVYRVRIQRKPVLREIELLGDQLELVPINEQVVQTKESQGVAKPSNGT